MKVREGTLDEAIRVHKLIPEFEPDYISKKLDEINTDSLNILIAEEKGQLIGYSLSYNRDNDGSLYAWMDAVLPSFRKQGVYSALTKSRKNLAIAEGYKSIKLKTRNSRREMLNFLITNDWNICSFEKTDDLNDSRITFVKNL